VRLQALEFLCDLLEVLACLSRPTLSRAIHGYRYWGRPGVSSRDLLALGKRGYLELESGARDRKDRVLRLTEKGRLCAMGGRDPEACWGRPWDGKWRMVLFDIPEKDRRLRDLLRRHLGAGHFGYLQNSVWVSPDPLDLENRLFKGTEINAESLLTLDAVPGTGEKNSDIVCGAWDFEDINRNYIEHLEVLGELPRQEEWAAGKGKTRLRKWIEAERDAWRNAVAGDPLLPRSLHPRSYLGEKAWKLRTKQLEKIARQLGRLTDAE
jgi:phenylacetic acid degradation operon negative regulatory protein